MDKHKALGHYFTNPYSKMEIHGENAYVTTNYRVLVENDLLSDLDFLCEPNDEAEERYCVKFTIPISLERELLRHRAMSFLEMSTRYCTLNSAKFDNELTFIIPDWSDLPEGHLEWRNDTLIHIDNPKESLQKTKLIKPYLGDKVDRFVLNCHNTERDYIDLISKGMNPEDAREVLSFSTKTEIIVTGFASQWKHLFDLRVAPSAHHHMRKIMIPLRDEFIKRKYLEDE